MRVVTSFLAAPALCWRSQRLILLWKTKNQSPHTINHSLVLNCRSIVSYLHSVAPIANLSIYSVKSLNDSAVLLTRCKSLRGANHRVPVRQALILSRNLVQLALLQGWSTPTFALRKETRRGSPRKVRLIENRRSVVRLTLERRVPTYLAHK